MRTDLRESARAVLATAVLGLVVLGGCAEEPEPGFLPEGRRVPRTSPRETTPPADPPRVVPRPASGDLAAPANVSAPPPEAERSASGLAWIVLQEGTGTRRPTLSDRVETHYSGWRAENGELFDSSVRRGRPAQFPVGGVIRGWQEGLQLMVEGEKRRFWIPADLAYEGRSGPQGMLVFDVELLRIL